MVKAAHWKDVVHWNSRYFSPEELACRGTGKLLIQDQALEKLERLRETLGKPMIINSAYRSPEHNAKVGGAKESRHMQGDAFDVSMANHDPVEFEEAARACGFTGFGYYPASNFIHIDTGPARVWGTKFKARKSRFAVEKKPPEKISSSATVQTGTVVGGTAAGSLASEVLEAKDKLEDAQHQWGTGDFIGIAIALIILVGVLYMLYRRWISAGKPRFSDIVKGVL